MIKITYSVQHVWSTESAFHEDIDGLTNTVGSSKPNPIAGFRDLEVDESALIYYSDQFEGANGKVTYWARIFAFINGFLDSHADEKSIHGKTISRISNIPVYIKARPALLDTTLSDIFQGAEIDDKSSFKTFQEWNVDAAYADVDGFVYVKLREVQKLPSMEFIKDFFTWSQSLPDLEIDLLNTAEYNASMPDLGENE